ncbi:GGDEF domain-containing protein [Pseudoalteromonas mariniglutinosa]|uniref:GGDEF domain-containing protein n=1 Tax=Pseudoalteromonas mariniglutinosa TaxID=206042 RepID=UPI0038510B96
MPSTPLFREEEADILLFIHSVFRKAIAKHHAHRLELFFQLQTRNEISTSLIEHLIDGMEILNTLERAAPAAILAHPLIVQIRNQQVKLLNKIEKICMAQSEQAPEEAVLRDLIDTMKRFDFIVNRFDIGLTASLTDIDELTGLLNRTALERDIKKEQAQAKRTDKTLCVALIDADYFKQVNDEYGHGFGDYVLEELADRFEDSIRPRDQVYRYGGEEFLILLPDTTTEQGCKIMTRLRERVARQVISDGEISITQTVSVGLAIISPDEDPTAAIERADIALYHAKETGRNKVVLWHQEMAKE